jgi:hypothetical protein
MQTESALSDGAGTARQEGCDYLRARRSRSSRPPGREVGARDARGARDPLLMTTNYTCAAAQPASARVDDAPLSSRLEQARLELTARHPLQWRGGSRSPALCR